MNPDISVITCSHNPRIDYLASVIEALSVQTLDKNSWEYLLIDNASTKPLSQLADLSWHPQGRHVTEEQLGLTNARLRGIQESSGELVVFVDDDNVLDSDYLQQALDLSSVWPMVGAFSGQVRPGFEKQPPEWTRQYWNRLAIREFEQDRWSNIPGLDYTAPNGAGLCVRRSVASEYVSYHANGKRTFMLDRAGKSLLSAGDLDLASTACDLGMGNALFTALKLTHLMPAERVQEDYLLRLMEDQTFSAVILDSFRSNGGSPAQKAWTTVVKDQLTLWSKSRRERRFLRAARKGHQKALKVLSNG